MAPAKVARFPSVFMIVKHPDHYLLKKRNVQKESGTVSLLNVIHKKGFLNSACCGDPTPPHIDLMYNFCGVFRVINNFF